MCEWQGAQSLARGIHQAGVWFSAQVGVQTLPPPLTPSLLRQPLPPRAILLKKFMMSGVNWVEGQEDPFEHVAGILTNVTRLPQARQLLLQPGRGLLQLLVAQLRCPGEMRKRGSAGAVKNCCVEAEVRGFDRGMSWEEHQALTNGLEGRRRCGGRR